ncbi:MAG TPA: glycosyltransferase family 9 protein [Opitutaceae bacterium]
MNLLILKVNHLGDNVVFVPVVQALRAAFPKARLHLVSTPAEAILYRGVLAAGDIFAPAERPAFNHAWRQQPWSVPGWLLRFARMRANGCLVSYDQGNFVHLISRWFGGDVRIGANMHYVRVRQSITHEVPPPTDWNVVRWNWAMGRALAQALDPRVDWPDVVPPPDLRHLLTRPSPEPKQTIVIHAGTKMAIRQWSMERFAELAARLARDHPVIWVDRPETRGVSLSPAITTVSPANVRELAQLVADARLYIGNNSGPMHLANAFGTPGVILSGPSSYGWDPYWYPDRWTVLRRPHLACLPCESPAKGVDRCANTGDPLACLNHWTVDLVEAAVRQRLSQAIR